MHTMLIITIDCVAIFFLFRAGLIYDYREEAKINMEIITVCMDPFDRSRFRWKVHEFGSPAKMLFALNKWYFQDFYGTIF